MILSFVVVSLVSLVSLVYVSQKNLSRTKRTLPFTFQFKRLPSWIALVTL